MPLEHPHALNPFYIEEDDQDPDHPWEGPQMIMHGGQPYDVHAPFYTEGDEPDPDYPWEDKYRHEAVTLGTFIGILGRACLVRVSHIKDLASAY